jgi:ATP-dependent Lhr-like helicase
VLVLHALRERINKARSLALRKRFCRQFNFEAGLRLRRTRCLLSLVRKHSFP